MLKPDFSRTISNDNMLSYGMYYTDTPGGTQYMYDLPQGESFVRSDVVHPNFKKRMKSGELIIGPYNATYEKITIGMGGGIPFKYNLHLKHSDVQILHVLRVLPGVMTKIEISLVRLIFRRKWSWPNWKRSQTLRIASFTLWKMFFPCAKT